jgi:IS30 family transposase
MKKHKQLTAADRKAIEILLKEKYKLGEIANKLDYHKSTISREVKRRKTPAGYIGWVAQVDYEKKRKRCKQKKKLDNTKLANYVVSKIKAGWSPEQVVGRINLENIYEPVCIETIYTYIYSDPVCVRESIYQYLRFGRKRRRKWKGRKTHKIKIPNRVSIHTRPVNFCLIKNIEICL